jgi:receptor protein-tyrosine kinase
MTEEQELSADAQRASDATRYFGMLGRWWWLLVAGAALAGTAAFFVTGTIQPVYRASSTLLINQVETPGSIVYSDVLTSERLTQTYRELITKRPVLEAVVDKANDPGLTVGELSSKLNTTAVKDTQLVTVSVRDESPERAASLANLVAQTFVSTETSDAITRAGTTRVVEPASVPSTPISPNLRLNVALAVLLGLVLAGGLALLIEYMDDTVKSSEDVRLVTGMSTLVEVGRLPHDKDRLPLSSRGLPMAEAETYAILRTNVQFSSIAHPARVILVASANSGDGKSTTASNFALACAEAGKTVALVDADLRRPSLHKAFSLENTTGLTNLLLSDAPLTAEALMATSHPNLFVVPSGPLPPNPTELLEWAGFDRVIEQLKSRVDLIVLDSAPLLAVADARILAAKADATILVADQGRTRLGALRAAYYAATRGNANVLGVVLNKVRRGRGSYGYYYYGKSYRSDEGKPGKPRGGGRMARPMALAAGAIGRSGSRSGGGHGSVFDVVLHRDAKRK